MFSDHDHLYMQQAVKLARAALYTATPNPRVGCVIVRDGKILGQGYTQAPGKNHAEIEALNHARAQGHDLAHATVYVTLEPCCHFGRTPPCVQSLIDARVARVIAAHQDPNPLVAGQGFEQLRAAGIDVRCGLLAQEARDLNPGFIKRMLHRRPWVRSKIAMSLDGHSALPNGKSQWITGKDARRDGHDWRARACALLTGMGTVRADDPLLNVREVATPRQPLRVLLDSKLEVALESKIVHGGNLLIVAAQRNLHKEQELIDHGCQVVYLPGEHGQVDLNALMQELSARSINELHVEAGRKLNSALIRGQWVDELLVYLAPSLLGQAPSLFDLPELNDLHDAWRLEFHDVAMLGDDLRILARFTTTRA